MRLSISVLIFVLGAPAVAADLYPDSYLTGQPPGENGSVNVVLALDPGVFGQVSLQLRVEFFHLDHEFEIGRITQTITITGTTAEPPPPPARTGGGGPYRLPGYCYFFRFGSGEEIWVQLPHTYELL